MLPLKILFFVNSLASPGGGAERILVCISRALAKRGHDVTVLTFDAPADLDFYSVGSKVERLRLGGSSARRGALGSVVRATRLRSAVAKIEPDVAVGFMHSAFIPAALALMGTGVPLIGSERTAFDHYRSRPFQRALLLATAPLLYRMTVNGQGIRRGFPKPLASRMEVIPNPVGRAVRSADPVGPEVKTLLSVGGLRPEKDHKTLISAFSRIADRFPDWRLRIVGEGPLLDALREQASALGLGDRIQLAGATKGVESEYLSAQLFVLPSIYEAFPNCLAEALAHGLPAIGYATCPGTNELIDPGVNGELAGAGDRVASLAECLADLMSAPTRRAKMGRAAPATVACYHLAHIVTLWEELLRGAADRGSGAGLPG